MLDLLPDAGHQPGEPLVLEQLARLDRGGDALDGLHHHAPGTQVQVADLRVAHLAGRQPDRILGGAEARVGPASDERPPGRHRCRGDRIARRGLFDPAVVAKLIDDHVDGRENHAHTLFPLMVFERWASQIQALLWEVRPRLQDGADIARLARFIIATLEGAILMSRVTKEIGVMENIAADLKRFISMHLKSGAPGVSESVAEPAGR